LLAKTRSSLRGRRPQQQHHHLRSPRTPELHRRPQPDSLISTAQPSTSPSCGQQPLHRPGGSSRSVRSRVALIAGRSADRRRWLGAPLAFSPNARPHHLRPEPDSSKKNSIKRNGDVGSSRAPRARARGFGAIKVYAPPLLLIFQHHALASTPLLNRGAKKTNEPTIPLIFQRRASREREQAPPLSVRLRAGCWRRPVARCAAGGRSSNIIISVRPERPSSIVAPNQIH